MKKITKSVYSAFEPTREERWLANALAETRIAIEAGDRVLAQERALLWANLIAERLQLSKTPVWKFFKRALAAKWFGKPESRAFPPNWDPEQALQYAYQFPDRSVRFSLFPKDIACHAVSIRLPIEERSKWYQLLSEADNSTDMEIFPEQRPDALCFRRYTTLFHEEIYYEVGSGQAMYVFEAERGFHPIVFASKTNNLQSFNFDILRPSRTTEVNESFIKMLSEEAKRFVELSDKSLTYQCFGLCRLLGLDSLSIEGYFDPLSNYQVVVDLDLPLDIAFMLQE